VADLTPKQRLFVEAYVGPSRGDATDAARRAGYAGDERALHRMGARNLENEFVQTAIAAASRDASVARFSAPRKQIRAPMPIVTRPPRRTLPVVGRLRLGSKVHVLVRMPNGRVRIRRSPKVERVLESGIRNRSRKLRNR
jgi:hypothetical protein